MRAIMISIKPKYVAKILNGEKTIEIRKTMPKCDLPIDVYIYCTKEDSLGRIKELPKDRYFVDCVETPQDFAKMDSGYDGKGKVVAKFTLNKAEELYIRWGWGWETNSIDDIKVLESKTCLMKYDFAKYLKGKKGYAWHISNLVIFDKPKELSEFYKGGDWGCDKAYYGDEAILTKAPQSWCYIESEK